MHIRNVTADDDSQRGPLGRYECHAYAVGDPAGKKHGFTVTVIGRKLLSFTSIATSCHYMYAILDQ